MDAAAHRRRGSVQIGGPSNAGGLFLGWVDRLVGPGGAVEPGRVPVWSPYMRGERAPLHDPDRRGVLDGLNLTHDGASVRRAAFEASGFVVRQIIEMSGASASRIVATGGGTRVAPWMQALADATGLPVSVSGVAEGAALGAAFLGRMAAGLESSITDAARWASVERGRRPGSGVECRRRGPLRQVPRTGEGPGIDSASRSYFRHTWWPQRRVNDVAARRGLEEN